MGGFIGNVVEWYDVAHHGYLAGVIARIVFPDSNSTAALIAAYRIVAGPPAIFPSRCRALRDELVGASVGDGGE